MPQNTKRKTRNITRFPTPDQRWADALLAYRRVSSAQMALRDALERAGAHSLAQHVFAQATDLLIAVVTTAEAAGIDVGFQYSPAPETPVGPIMRYDLRGADTQDNDDGA